jgi:double-stranded uracil-DNA glycosylase
VLPDILAPNLLVVFVGTSKSTTSARAGHYYANSRNMFWNLLEATGLTDRHWIGSADDRTVLSHRIGLTDLVPTRAASSDSLLKASDFDVPAFIAKMQRFAPAVIAFNGEKAASKVARHLEQPKPEEGPLEFRIGGAHGFRLPSSSSAHATGGYAAKRSKWVEFGRWVGQVAI